MSSPPTKAAVPADGEASFRPLFATDASSGGESSTSGVMKTVTFSSGNPRVEETRGIMHLYPEDVLSFSNLPVGRNSLVCVLHVPNHMTYADFCRFCGIFLSYILEMRIVRNDGVEDKYSVLMKFNNQNSADGFYSHFNRKLFSSLERDICHVIFVVDVQYTASIEHVHGSLSSSAEQPTCPVCLERLDQDSGGILTTICNHSFHCSCISEWTDSSCPVCRYCQQQPEKSVCSVCETLENLWMCVICGFVGCGRYKDGHAIRHWKETQHCYSLELETQRVWDYVGDNYVHRLIQSKTDGKLVEFNHHCSHADGSCECSDSAISEALLSSKVEAIKDEYNVLLTTQLENQRNYFESVLLEIKAENEKKISEAVEKAVNASSKLQKLVVKLESCNQDIKFLADLNENLMKNEDMWKTKVTEVKEREQKSVTLKKEKIHSLEEQLQNLMLLIEGGNDLGDSQ